MKAFRPLDHNPYKPEVRFCAVRRERPMVAGRSARLLPRLAGRRDLSRLRQSGMTRGTTSVLPGDALAADECDPEGGRRRGRNPEDAGPAESHLSQEDCGESSGHPVVLGGVGVRWLRNRRRAVTGQPEDGPTEKADCDRIRQGVGAGL